MRKIGHHFKTLPFTTKLSVLAAILLFTTITITISNALSRPTTQQTQAAPASKLIFGTNLTLNDANDQFITSAASRQALKQANVQSIRIPIRTEGGPAPEAIQAAQYAKELGMTPLIILKFQQPDPAGAGKQVITAMNQIFGNSTVYYEFGNEVDLAYGIDEPAYTAKWNQVIPQLKPLAPNGKFGGPTNYAIKDGSKNQASYVANFVKNAIPKPDFISWHEYTCGNTSTADQCIQNISNWTAHINEVKNLIQQAGNTIPPIFITEWNYDANPPANDSRNTNAFQQLFVQTALQELIKDGVTAAYQYVGIGNPSYNLINPSGQLTSAGQAFAQVAVQLGTANQTSPTLTTTTTTPPYTTPSYVCAGSLNNICPTNSPTPTPNLRLSPTGTGSALLPTISSIAQKIGTAPVCSESKNKSCGYTSNCQGSAEGATCERQVNGCGRSSSGSNVYVCRKGKWVYDHWVRQNQAICSFCQSKNNSLLQQLKDLLQKLRDLLAGITPTQEPTIETSPTGELTPTISTAPSITQETPTPTASEAATPTTSPCLSSQATVTTVQTTSKKSGHSHTNSKNKNSTALLSQLLEVFKQLLHLINTLIGLSPTQTPTPTASPCITPIEMTPTEEPTPTIQTTPILEPTNTPTPTDTPTPTEEPTLTQEPTQTPVITPSPTKTPPNDTPASRRLFNAFLHWLQRILEIIRQVFKFNQRNTPPSQITPIPTIEVPTISVIPSEIPSCIPRPACLESEPRCLIAEPPEGWCPATQVPTIPLPTGPVPQGCHYETRLCSNACVANGPCPVPCGYDLVCTSPTP
jgi:hypothetical protein